jgi:hypothetical protein
MALQTVEKEIGGRVYAATQLPAMRSLKLLARLGKVAAPALAAGLDSDMGKAAGLLFEKLDDSEVEHLIKALLEPMLVTDGDTQRPVLTGFDAAYAGDRLPEVFSLIRFALEVQYGPTLAALGPLLAAQTRQQGPAGAAPKQPEA